MILDGFTVENWKHLFLPTEDAYTVSKGNRNIVAVADGITRDPKFMQVIDLKNSFERARFALGYNWPSPAKTIADIFCNDFVSLGKGVGLNEETGRKILSQCNRDRIREINERLKASKGKFNYLQKDIPGCVAAGAIESEGIIYYGFIGDCGIALFDENGKLRFVTPNEGPNTKGSIDEDIALRYRTDFAHPVGRKIIRSQYRNNPSNPLAYGALTGEKSAEHYIQSGAFQMHSGEILITFTDGIEEVIRKGDLADILKARRFEQLKQLCKAQVKSEGSLAFLVRE